MPNDPKLDLIYAILSMDSYNRGYGAEINNLDIDFGVTKIGNYTIQSDRSDLLAQAAGFYAIAYQNAAGNIVIAYRGTDKNLANPFGDEGSDFVGIPGTVYLIFKLHSTDSFPTRPRPAKLPTRTLPPAAAPMPRRAGCV